jgi:HK97 family phage major capsid protein
MSRRHPKETQRAVPGEISIGDFVTWSSAIGQLSGQVTEIEFEEEVSSDEKFGVKLCVLLYSQSPNGTWEPTDMKVEPMLEEVTKIEPLRAAEEPAPEPVETVRQIEGAQLRELLASNGRSTVQERLLPGGLTIEKDDAGEMVFSFSSEAPVERWFGRETLSHEPGAMDLSRANDGAPYLWNHDRDVVLGSLEKAWLQDRRLYTKTKWSRNTEERGSVEWKRRNDIEDGTCRNVSFAYEILSMVERGQDDYVVTKWNVLEVSSVSVPADQTVGIGRAHEEAEVIYSQPPVTIEHEVREAPAPEPAAIAVSPVTEPMTAEITDPVALRQQAAEGERNRIENVRALCERFEVTEDLTNKLIREGYSLEDACVAVREASPRMVKHESAGRIHQSADSNIGLTEKEVRQYSLLNVVRYLADPNDRTRSAAGYELELSQEVERKEGRSANGVLVPFDILGSREFSRGQNVSTLAEGGALVSTDYLGGSYIDLLKNRSSIMSLNVTMLSGLQGNVEIPKKTGKSTYYFVGEDVNVTDSQLSFGLVNMTPKTLGVRVPISRRAMLQTSPDIEALVRADMVEEVALGMDATALYGSGSSSRPLGLSNYTGIGAVTLGGGVSKTFSAALGGGTHDCGDWADYVDLETAIYASNADAANMAYLANTGVRGALKQTLRASAAGSDYIMRDDGTVNGYNMVVSNQVQTNDVFFGNFSDAVVGLWSGVDLVVDQYTQSAKGQVILTVMQDFDFALRRVESFAKGT